MFQPIELAGQSERERIERAVASAAQRSEIRREPALSIRRAIGHRFIQVGARLAAEPSLESVRSR
jgi:hypothetical protein